MGGFKASVLDELESLGETMDLKSLIREAMEEYSAVHADARGLSAGEIPTWEESLSTLRKAYTSKFGQGDFALEVS